MIRFLVNNFSAGVGAVGVFEAEAIRGNFEWWKIQWDVCCRWGNGVKCPTDTTKLLLQLKVSCSLIFILPRRILPTTTRTVQRMARPDETAVEYLTTVAHELGNEQQHNRIRCSFRFCEFFPDYSQSFTSCTKHTCCRSLSQIRVCFRKSLLIDFSSLWVLPFANDISNKHTLTHTPVLAHIHTHSQKDRNQFLNTSKLIETRWLAAKRRANMIITSNWYLLLFFGGTKRTVIRLFESRLR